MRGFRAPTIVAIFILWKLTCTYGQTKTDLSGFRQDPPSESIEHYHISGDNLYYKDQNIHIIALPLQTLKSKYSLDLAWSDSTLYPTSHFAKESGAVIAMNAGFFNIAKGGSITFVEYENKKVSIRSWRGDTPAGQKTNFSGALLMLSNGTISIEKAKISDDYLDSDIEKWVLVTGPLLILNRKKAELLKGSFVDKAHPRTALGITKDSLLLITVDGRNPKAKGMNLHELQDLMISLECEKAINLDGGGSTTMCIQKDETISVVNCPSDNKKFDNKGERKVANALVLLKK